MRSIFSSSESCLSNPSARASMAGVETNGACAQVAGKEASRRMTIKCSLRVITDLGRNRNSRWEKARGPKPRAFGERLELEEEFGAELYHAETTGPGAECVGVRSPVRVLRDAERGAGLPLEVSVLSEANVLVVKVGVVEHIERLQAKLDGVPFRERDVLEQRHINFAFRRCAGGLASRG